jgi:hypothetical protein
VERKGVPVEEFTIKDHERPGKLPTAQYGGEISGGGSAKTTSSSTMVKPPRRCMALTFYKGFPVLLLVRLQHPILGKAAARPAGCAGSPKIVCQIAQDIAEKMSRSKHVGRLHAIQRQWRVIAGKESLARIGEQWRVCSEILDVFHSIG